MKILAIAAHPDDIEIFMYGLLAKFKIRGDQIFTIIATDGAMGGLNKGKALIKKRKLEAISGLKNLSSPIFIDIPDGELGDKPVHKTLIKQNILKIMPDLIITHSQNDYHADHRSLSIIVSSVVSHYVPILYCDTLMGINFQPNYYVDVSDNFVFKKEAIMRHSSQNPKRFVDLSVLMNSYRSAQCNSPKGTYAEAYCFINSFPFSDIRNILPESP
ncbi:PIG-L family deacetylase, partial [Alphaproteobacteria bacterium]|nr:PIG-L family deacetylase [Alphaproteobacteria bacterium]